ncbi:MAG TPA: dienelactone hydrolase family protein [Alphaproteobacteria bacterium]|nr:dienelactone hydrolase family protein [Alphaproteobacteria bacterium]
MAGSEIRIDGPDGEFMGYLAKPDSGRGPGLVVIQEIFGVNRVMRDLTDGFAAAGYVALCPDLFWRQEPGIQLSDHREDEWRRALEFDQAFDADRGIADIRATLAAVRAEEGCTGKAGAVGYCLGGMLAYLSATRTDTDAGVGYYGIGIETRLLEADRIGAPLMLHIAERDSFVASEAQARIREALARHPRVTLHSYPEAEHAFARPGGDHYDAEAARLADDRTAEFLHRHLS